MIYTSEKTVADLKDKLPKDKVDAIESAAKKLKETLASEDVGKIRTENENLKKVLQEAGSYIYQQAGTQKPEEEKKDGDTVDADYTKVDEDKK